MRKGIRVYWNEFVREVYVWEDESDESSLQYKDVLTWQVQKVLVDKRRV